jgi:hypothetical protein
MNPNPIGIEDSKISNQVFGCNTGKTQKFEERYTHREVPTGMKSFKNPMFFPPFQRGPKLER